MKISNRLRSLWLQGLAKLGVPGSHIVVHTEWETLQTIGERGASIARYGDGELMVMLGRGIYFQEYDPELARRLRELIRQCSPEFLIGLPPFGSMSITREVWRKRWEEYRRLFSYLIRSGAEYYSTAISRPGSVGNWEPEPYYEAFSKLWEGRDLVLVHNSPDSVAHPLFRNARQVHYVPCLPEHAFREYAALLERASAFLRLPRPLFLIAAGPTACLLAWDLAQRGAQALDVGHLARAYDEHTKSVSR